MAKMSTDGSRPTSRTLRPSMPQKKVLTDICWKMTEPQQCLVIIWETWQRAQGVDLASQSELVLEQVRSTEVLPQDTEHPLLTPQDTFGAGIHRLDLPWHIHITSHGCLIGLGSGEFGSQVDDLCSLSHSSGHSWAVFTVWQVALSYWGETAIWVLLPWAIVLGLQQFLRWWCVSSGIHINARTQGYQAEHCLLRTWSILFTSLISGFNVFLISVFRHSA